MPSFSPQQTRNLLGLTMLSTIKYRQSFRLFGSSRVMTKSKSTTKLEDKWEAKSGSDWNMKDLKNLDIKIVEETNPLDFFEICTFPPLLIVPDAILNTKVPIKDSASLDKSSRKFLQFMEWANQAEPWEASVNDFAHLILLMHYEENGCYVRSSIPATFKMCNEKRKMSGATDLLVMGDAGILVLLQEDKKYGDMPYNPEVFVPQLVAAIIAAAVYNTTEHPRLIPLSQTIPLIFMRGTTPRFFKMTVTPELIYCLADGITPASTTEIFQYTPVFPSNEKFGMVPLDNRRASFECFEAFKSLVFKK